VKAADCKEEWSQKRSYLRRSQRSGRETWSREHVPGLCQRCFDFVATWFAGFRITTSQWVINKPFVTHPACLSLIGWVADWRERPASQPVVSCCLRHRRQVDAKAGCELTTSTFICGWCQCAVRHSGCLNLSVRTNLIYTLQILDRIWGKYRR